MLDSIIVGIIKGLEGIISSVGIWGLAGLMALESCNIPIPSEATLPFAGYLVSKGELNFHIAAWASAFGCLIGSIPSYYIGYFGGRKFIEKYGKYFFVTKQDLENLKNLFLIQWGLEIVVFQVSENFSEKSKNALVYWSEKRW